MNNPTGIPDFMTLPLSFSSLWKVRIFGPLLPNPPSDFESEQAAVRHAYGTAAEIDVAYPSKSGNVLISVKSGDR
jgi:hypothetical protein